MDDWNAFKESVPWFVKPESNTQIGEQQKGGDLNQHFQKKFPILSRLLNHADVTAITIDDSQYKLCAWDSINGNRTGWLCPTPPKEKAIEVCEDHNLLFTVFGGIVERFNEPEETWLLNLEDSLTFRESLHDASFIDDYQWSFDDAGIDIPIQLSEYYVIAREANGNSTLCHRKSADILFFAPDHSFDHISVFRNCPEYTLYSINGVATFKEWVEIVADQWLSNIKEIV